MQENFVRKPPIREKLRKCSHLFGRKSSDFLKKRKNSEKIAKGALQTGKSVLYYQTK